MSHYAHFITANGSQLYACTIPTPICVDSINTYWLVVSIPNILSTSFYHKYINVAVD